MKITLLFASMTLVMSSTAFSFPRYDKVDIDVRQVYTTYDFPYEKYFVCIEKNAPELNTYLARDPLFRHTVKTASAETGALFYRYIKKLPEKDRFNSPTIRSSNIKEQVPFYNDKKYFYPHGYISRKASKYHYDIESYNFIKEQWKRSNEERYWIFNRINFYKRISDYELSPMHVITNLLIVTSIDINKVKEANSEQEAYNSAYSNTKLYYFPSNPSNCK